MDQFLPHAYCLRFDQALLLAFIIGNLGIASAYFSIPASIFWFIRKRKDLPYPWMFVLFACFIFSCGLTHVMKVCTLYYPAYWYEAGLDLLTAVLSIGTAIALWPIIPKALGLRSPRELENVIKSLEIESSRRIESEQNIRLLIASLKDYVIYSVDLHGYITFWNRRESLPVDYTEEELIGKHFSIFFTDEDKEAGLPARMLEEARLNGSFENEGWRVRKDGERIWKNVIAAAQKDKNGNVISYAIIAKDMTVYRRNEEAKRELTVLREREDFMAALTHDLKNPLVGANRILDLLTSGALGEVPPKQNDILLQLRESNRGLLDLLRNLIEIYRLDRDMRTLDLKELEVATLLSNGVKDMAHIAAKKVSKWKLKPALRVLKSWQMQLSCVAFFRICWITLLNSLPWEGRSY